MFKRPIVTLENSFSHELYYQNREAWLDPSFSSLISLLVYTVAYPIILLAQIPKLIVISYSYIKLKQSHFESIRILTNEDCLTSFKRIKIQKNQKKLLQLETKINSLTSKTQDFPEKLRSLFRRNNHKNNLSFLQWRYNKLSLQQNVLQSSSDDLSTIQKIAQMKFIKNHFKKQFIKEHLKVSLCALLPLGVLGRLILSYSDDYHLYEGNKDGLLKISSLAQHKDWATAHNELLKGNNFLFHLHLENYKNL